jgi:hypothetical protein
VQHDGLRGLARRSSNGGAPSASPQSGLSPPRGHGGQVASRPRNDNVLSPDRGAAGSDVGPNPFGTKMRPEWSLETQLVVLRVRGPA